MRPIRTKWLTTRSAGLWALVLIAVLLAIQHLAGWYVVQLGRISKEQELEAHLADLGRLAAAHLGDPALALNDLARDVSRTGEGRPDAELFAAWVEPSWFEPFRDFAAQARLERVLAIAPTGHVLADATPATTTAGAVPRPFEFQELDRPEIQRARGGDSAASVAYSFGGDAFKRHYEPLGDPSAGAPPLLCLVAGRSYLEELQLLGARVRQVNLAMTLLMLVIGVLIWRLIQRQHRAERQAADADRLVSVGHLAAGFAHELRNPMGIIRAFTEELRRSVHDGAPPDDLREACDDIVEEVDRMNRLLEQFLSYSRGGDGGPGRTTAPVAETARAVLAILRPQAEKQGVRLEFGVRGGEGPRAAAADPHVGLEPGRLKQILMNLMLNAIEATPRGGCVALELREGRRQIELRIRDEGPGIRPDVARRIFEPFYTTRAGGTGLGLAISRQLAVGAGGDLRLDGAAGRGACFVLTLPRRTPKAAAPEAADPRPPAGRPAPEPVAHDTGKG